MKTPTRLSLIAAACGVLVGSILALAPFFIGSCQAQPPAAPRHVVIDANGMPREIGTPAPARWRWHALNETQDSLYKNGVMVGAYDHEGNYYRPYFGREVQTGRDLWGDVTDAPVAPRARQVHGDDRKPAGPPNGVLRPPVEQVEAPRQDALPTGVDLSKISKTDRFSHNGAAATKDEVFQLFEGKLDQAALKDDSGKDVLTVQCSDKAKRAEFMRQFAGDPAYATLRARANAWESAPDDWSLDAGFVKGEGLVTLQNAAGEVLARAQVADITNAGQLIGELRKANPDYDPAKDPTPNKPASDPLGLGGDGKKLIVGSALALAAVFHFRKKRAANVAA